MDRAFEFVRRSTSRIVIGAGIEARLPQLLRESGAQRMVLVYDEALQPLAQRLLAALSTAKGLPVHGGESLKTLTAIADMVGRLRAVNADRSTTLLALGGGTVTDFTGFLASIYLRGVPFIACPTTTLAMCDAALGGKNGVDFDGRKNELGTIRQPELIVADTAWLQTLPDAMFREGFVEAVKKATVLDAGHFTRLEQLAPLLHQRDAAAAREAIDMAVAMKMAVVLADEGESDRRRWLNFGHTIGHALESLAAGALRHGECIAIGMLAECRAAANVVPPAVFTRLHDVLAGLGAPTTFPRAFADADRLWSLAGTDKKARGDHVPMIVPTAIGTGIVAELTRARLAVAIA